MKNFTLTMLGRAQLLSMAAVVAVFAAAASAQTDSATVTFIVNVNATVSMTDGVTQKQFTAAANQETVSPRLPVIKTTGIANGAQRQINAPAIIRNRGGKVIVNVPAQSRKTAEVLLYTVNGKRLLRYTASAASAANCVTRPNLATGVYLLSVRGTEGNIAASRITHSGGGLNISVAFGGEDLSFGKRLAKEAEQGEWEIKVSAAGYIDTAYTLRPVAGANTVQYITLRKESYTLLTNASPSNGGSVSRNPNNTSYSPGTSITVTAIAASGYTFTGWSGASTSTSSPVTITMDDDKTLTAIFQQQQLGVDTSFTDNRDGKTYKKVMIGGKTWMAENLNYQTASGSWCYGNADSLCVKYGRLYDWNTAMTACPTGWHLPTNEEWDILVEAAGNSAGMKLAAVSIGGTDVFGFSALLGGHRDTIADTGIDDGGSFGNGGSFGIESLDPHGNAYYRSMGYYFIDTFGLYWSASEYTGNSITWGGTGDDAYFWQFGRNSGLFGGGGGVGVGKGGNIYKDIGYSVRCVAD